MSEYAAVIAEKYGVDGSTKALSKPGHGSVITTSKEHVKVVDVELVAVISIT